MAGTALIAIPGHLLLIGRADFGVQCRAYGHALLVRRFNNADDTRGHTLVIEQKVAAAALNPSPV